MSVHLACGEVAGLLREAGSWLSASERARLQAVTSESRRAQFLAARWQARSLLAQVLGGAPGGWMLDAPNDAPPQVIGRPDLFLSVSHSGDRVACGLADEAVGLDLEQPRRARDLEGLASVCCTRREQEMLSAACDREALFYTLWTVKEAWLKQRREWVSPRRLAQIECAPVTRGEVRTWSAGNWKLAVTARQVQWWTPEPQAAGAWAVRTLA
jgi:4'-phosphopantetheinyl transferase